MITARARISPNTAQCPTPSPTHPRRPLVRRSPSQDPSALWHAAAGTPSAAAGSSDPWKPQCSTCCSCSDLRVSGTAAYRPGSAALIAKLPDPTGIREVSETSWGGCAHCSPAIETRMASLPGPAARRHQAKRTDHISRVSSRYASLLASGPSRAPSTRRSFSRHVRCGHLAAGGDEAGGKSRLKNKTGEGRVLTP